MEKKLSKRNLLNNFFEIKKQVNNKKICAVVKANAYGHGSVEVANILKQYVDFFAVANVDEGVKIRGITSSPILVLGKTKNFKTSLLNSLSISISSIEELKNLIDFMNIYANILNVNFAKIHIKVNSGMNRYGVSTLSEFKQMIKLILACDKIVLEGVYTHFSTADCDYNYYLKQKAIFLKFISSIPNKLNPIVHVGGSFSILNESKTVSNFDMFRIGLFLYGYGTKEICLKKVLKIISKINLVRYVKKGERVGYANGFVAEKNMKIAIVPVGYADGFLRSFKNEKLWVCYVDEKGKKHVKKCQIVGNICMDCFMLDVSNISGKILYVEVLSNAEMLAKRHGTISYEILTNLNNCRL